MASELSLALRRDAALTRINDAAARVVGDDTVILDPAQAKDPGIGVCVHLEQIAGVMEAAAARLGGAKEPNPATGLNNLDDVVDTVNGIRLRLSYLGFGPSPGDVEILAQAGDTDALAAIRLSLLDVDAQTAQAEALLERAFDANLDGNVQEVGEHVNAATNLNYLYGLHIRERAGKTRKGVLDAIAARIAALEAAEQEQDPEDHPLPDAETPVPGQETPAPEQVPGQETPENDEDAGDVSETAGQTIAVQEGETS